MGVAPRNSASIITIHGYKPPSLPAVIAHSDSESPIGLHPPHQKGHKAECQGKSAGPHRKHRRQRHRGYYLNQRLWEQGEVWGMELEKVREFVEFTDSMSFTVAARTLHIALNASRISTRTWTSKPRVDLK